MDIDGDGFFFSANMRREMSGERIEDICPLVKDNSWRDDGRRG